MFEAMKRGFKATMDVLNTDVGVLASKVGHGVKAALGLTIGTGVAVGSAFKSSVAMAQDSDLVTAATAGITAAKADTLTVGAVVIAAVAAIVVVVWIISMVRKH